MTVASNADALQQLSDARRAALAEPVLVPEAAPVVAPPVTPATTEPEKEAEKTPLKSPPRGTPVKAASQAGEADKPSA